MTLLDKILIYLLGSVLTYLILYSIIKSVAASIFITLLLIILFRAIILHLYVRRKNKSVISVNDMENELALMGGEQSEFIMKAVGKYFKPQKHECGFFITDKEKKIMIVTNFKFSATGADEVARFYRIAKKENVYEIWVLGKSPARNVCVFCASLDIKIKFIPSKKLHTYLLKQNALMPKRKIIKNPQKIKLKNIFNGAFTKKRAKYFALSGLWLAIFAFFGVMRIYYITICCICFALSLICVLKRE